MVSEPTDPFGTFSTPGNALTGFTFNLTNLTVGETVYLDFTLNASVEGASSTVPLPPSVWLFGSGLVGLVVARRRLRG